MKKIIIIGLLIGAALSVTFISNMKESDKHQETEYVTEEVHLKQTEDATVEETPPGSSRTYFDVPLSTDVQDHIFELCEEYGICPAIVVAMIERESGFDMAAVGDSGQAVGLMQIHERWHGERMKRLGCTNLYDPYQNVTVGIDILVELREMNSDLYWVLMAYNAGMDEADSRLETGNYSDYVLFVIARAAELERKRDYGNSTN